MPAPSPEQLLISAPVLPMYAAPDLASEQVSQALLGMPVHRLQASAGWLRIETPDRYRGWVETAGVVNPPEGWGAPRAEVTDLWINLRLRNDYRLAPAAHAPLGTHLPLLEEAEGWRRLLLPDGRALWTEAHRVTPLGETPLRPREARAITRTALRLRGVPYLWGGCSPLGIDCSGFVQLVMRLHGIALLRDAGQQATQGDRTAQPAAADLVFFSPEGPDGKITHVGLMLDHQRFVHALGSACVRINRLSEPCWTPRLHSVRRYL